MLPLISTRTFTAAALLTTLAFVSTADAGVPTCVVAGHADYQPLKPSEEHLPVDVPASSAVPAIGSHVYLIPRHVCPTVNNFDHALIVQGGRITSIESVTARGREIAIHPVQHFANVSA